MGDALPDTHSSFPVIEVFEQSLIEAFPAGVRGIHIYLAMVKDVAASMKSRTYLACHAGPPGFSAAR